MPIYEPTPVLGGRGRAFLRAQLPLLVGTLFVTAEGLWAIPDTATSTDAVAGLAVVLAVSAAFWLLPRRWWTTGSMLLLAVADIVGVALLRLAYFDELASVGMLAVFPVVWLAYAFRRWVILVAVAGAFFITLLPILVEGPTPSSPIEIARVVTLPVLITGLSIAVGEAARQLATSQRRLHEANAELQDSLRQERDSALLSRTLFESVDVALAFYDTDDHLVMSNSLAEAAVAAAGFRLDEPPYAGPHVRRADNKTVIPLEEQIIPRALRGDLENHEMEWIGPHGHQIAIVANTKAVARSDGTTWGTLVVAYNVTDLARSLRTKEEFITTVSHELRTPLTSIIGYLELLIDELGHELVAAPGHVDAGPDDPRGRFVVDTLGRIRGSALNLELRIQELLDTAEQRRDLSLAPTDLSRLAETVVRTFTTQARTATLDLRLDAPQPEWATVDAPKIEQAVENLLSNAVKYTAAPGSVTLAVRGHEDHVLITVADTGVGMTSDEVDQVFDPFWRAEHARDQAVQGIGIGLGLVRDICRAHHATVDVASDPGRGTTATIRLPRRF